MLIRRKIIPAIITGTIVDLETTGLPGEGADIITLGTVSANRLQIIQRTVERDFEKTVKDVVSSLPRPFFAFNKRFEEQMLDLHIDGELQAEKFEKKSRAIRIDLLQDPFEGNGFEAIAAWRNYKATGNRRFLEAIMDHNESDLLLETCLLIVRHSKSMELKISEQSRS